MLFPFSVAKWRTWLERVEAGRDDGFPIERALRWMQLESGGNVCSVGRVGKAGEAYPGHVYEAGLAQTYFSSPSSRAYGVTVDQLRAKCGGGTSMPTNLTDADRLLHARVHMDTCRDHRDRTRSRLSRAGVSIAESSNDFWNFVKLTHAAPAMFDYLGRSGASTWRQFRRFIEGQSYAQLAAVNSGIASRVWRLGVDGKRTRTDYLARVFRNCEEFGGSGGFVELELVLLLALAMGAHLVITRFLA